MKSTEDNQRFSFSNDSLSLCSFTYIGGREEQQDCFGYEVFDGEVFVVLCDGMGGYSGGKKASNAAVEYILAEYSKRRSGGNPVEILKSIMVEADELVCAITDDNGNLLHGGSTVVAVSIINGCLYWTSVGDSRAYLARGNELVQLTLDLNYGTVLKEKLEAGIITQDEYQSEENKADALICYLGVGNLDLMDYNNNAISLLSGDCICVVSDGFYRAISNEELSGILGNFKDVSDVAQLLMTKIQKSVRNGNLTQDNTTAIFIKIK